jgi:hypothetical protein
MPERERRHARAKRLVKAYLKFRQGYKKRTIRRRHRHLILRRRQNDQLHQPQHHLTTLSDLSSISSDSDSESHGSAESSVTDWSDILGSDWRSASSFSSYGSAIDGVDFDGDVPELVSINARASPENESDIDGDNIYSEFGDDEMESSVGSSDDDENRPGLKTWIREEIEHMYCKRYEVPRTRIPKPDESFLHHLLMTLKAGRPEDFRGELRVSPYTFDRLVAKISVDPVFANNSETAPQTPVEEQLAVALYHFGHDGNAAGLQSTARWAGVGKGTVHLFTRRVMVAVLRPEFMQDAVRYPTPEEKEEAKKWVAKRSCKAWRGGWCFVDGTLVPLSKRPFWFGESYFDRKCRYSLSFQVSGLKCDDHCCQCHGETDLFLMVT